MKIILTGSLGHISKPLARELLQKGHSITIISSNPAKQKEIEAIGATASIGTIEDIEFLTAAFTGADAVYCMTPPNFTAPDQLAYYQKTGECYALAIQQSGICRVVYLSSYGAHLPSGTGFITGSYINEKILDAIPDIALTHIRPTFFYYNFLGFIPMIKNAGFIGNVYGGEDLLPMVSPSDIAAAIAGEITQTQNTRKILYVSSDEMTCNEAAGILGTAIGKPDLQWKLLAADKVKEGLLANGIPDSAASNLVELGQAIHTGILREDYDLHKPVFGSIKLKGFAKDFAAVYNSSSKNINH